MFTAALFSIAKIWKQPKHPSTDEWIKKMWCIYTREYYSDIKKNGILPFATTWMDLEGIMLSEISQRKTNTIWFHSCVGFKWLSFWRVRSCILIFSCKGIGAPTLILFKGQLYIKKETSKLSMDHHRDSFLVF